MAFPLHQVVVFFKRVKIILCVLIFVGVLAKKFSYLMSDDDYRYKYGADLMADQKLANEAIQERFIMLQKDFEKSQGTVHQHVNLEDDSVAQTQVAKVDRVIGEAKSAGQSHHSALAERPREHLVKDVQVQHPCTNVHAFYYPWYGNPKMDGQYSHWNHKVLPHWDKEVDKIYQKSAHKPPNDIASDFYPELGAYSSRDPHIIDEHFRQLVSARIGVIVVSYYPSGTADENGKPWDDIYSLLLDKAVENGMKVAFHIEPYKGRNEKTVRGDIIHIVDTYGSHNGFYKYKISSYRQVPLFYVYDSYLTKQEDWAKVLKPAGPISIRGTKYDSIIIGLLVDMPHTSFTSVGGFDGLYTYFASNGFTYGSKRENWREISMRSHDMNFIFIPSVGPGYIDTNIRPWNSENTRQRSVGGYYKSSWTSALEVKPKIISITSFNEWHEGTQIEKAVPKSSQSRSYFDYKPFGSDYYLKLTRDFVDKYQACV